MQTPDLWARAVQAAHDTSLTKKEPRSYNLLRKLDQCMITNELTEPRIGPDKSAWRLGSFRMA